MYDVGDGGRGGISITELSPREWRICDEHIAEGDPAALLGFIQRVADAYEVTNLRRLWERSYYSSFERATASLAARPVLDRSVLA